MDIEGYHAGDESQKSLSPQLGDTLNQRLTSWQRDALREWCLPISDKWRPPFDIDVCDRVGG
jgi:hypothetical protein